MEPFVPESCSAHANSIYIKTINSTPKSPKHMKSWNNKMMQQNNFKAIQENCFHYLYKQSDGTNGTLIPVYLCEPSCQHKSGSVL